jgi:hypothetical protein
MSEKTEFENCEISQENILQNLKYIIDLNDLNEMYNETIRNGFCCKDKLRHVFSAYYYYIFVKRPNSNSLKQLGMMLSRLEDIDSKNQLTKAQYLYFIYYVRSLNLDNDSKDELIAGLYM